MYTPTHTHIYIHTHLILDFDYKSQKVLNKFVLLIIKNYVLATYIII